MPNRGRQRTFVQPRQSHKRPRVSRLLFWKLANRKCCCLRRRFDRAAVNRSVGVPPACAITVYCKSSTSRQSDCRGLSEKNRTATWSEGSPLPPDMIEWNLRSVFDSIVTESKFRSTSPDKPVPLLWSNRRYDSFFFKTASGFYC